MESRPLHELSAREAAERIRTGTLTSEVLVRACLERIEAREAGVRAWAWLDPDLALHQARERDATGPGGPLHGVPVGVKDLIDTADMPTEYGSPIYAGHRPDTDAACVARLRSAGAVILGKTVTTEFALFTPGKTVNPHDPGRTPGGSSSGSAAAVADRMVPLALGTQTAGSITRPAGFCGVFGLKPTFGLVDAAGVAPCSPTLDTVGLFARSAEDLALGAAVMAGSSGVFFDPDDARLEERPRIGFVRTHEWERAEPSTRATLESLAHALADVAEVSDIDLPGDFAGLVEAQERIMGHEAAASLARERADHPELLSERLRTLLDTGAAVTPEQSASATTLAQHCRAQLAALFADHDILLAPSVLGEPPEGLEATGDPLFCRIWTLLGPPTVAVPGLRGPNGLPLGVQIVAAHHRDGLALDAARWLAGHIGVHIPDSLSR